MPQNAHIVASGGDYTTVIAWEAGEQGSNYGSRTIGEVDGFFDQGSAALIINGGFAAFGAGLIPFDSADGFNGIQRKLCGIRSTNSARAVRARGTIDVLFTGIEIHAEVGAGAMPAVEHDNAGLFKCVDSLLKSNGTEALDNIETDNCVVQANNTSSTRDPLSRTCVLVDTSVFYGSTIDLGTTATVTATNTFSANGGSGNDFDALVTQTNNASTDTSASTLTNVVISANFEDSDPFTNLDWQISGGSSLDTNGIGAFILAAGGVTVTAATANYNYTGIAGTIDLTGEVIVTGQTANYNYTAIVASIELGTEIIVTGQTANYNYTGIIADIELTGLITVVGQTANYDYDGIAADITLQGSIIITGSTANYDYNALNATIILQGPITINPKNIIRVSRKSNTIRVKRKSNIIRVR